MNFSLGTDVPGSQPLSAHTSVWAGPDSLLLMFFASDVRAPFLIRTQCAYKCQATQVQCTCGTW